MFPTMAVDRSYSLLGRLRRIVKTVKILLRFGIMGRWRIASLIRAGSGKRWLTSQDSLGLRAAFDDEDGSEGSIGSSPRQSPAIMRTISCPSDDDVDKRAEIFIANFYKQLKIERQVSLELRYQRSANIVQDRFSP